MGVGPLGWVGSWVHKFTWQWVVLGWVSYLVGWVDEMDPQTTLRQMTHLHENTTTYIRRQRQYFKGTVVTVVLNDVLKISSQIGKQICNVLVVGSINIITQPDKIHHRSLIWHHFSST